LKILHPSTPPTDEEFEEYVSYAVECRRRVKEQMNKRKTDDEFALINLSYISADGQEKIVYCPESQTASATQEPSRKNIHAGELEEVATKPSSPAKTPEPVAPALSPRQRHLKLKPLLSRLTSRRNSISRFTTVIPDTVMKA